MKIELRDYETSVILRNLSLEDFPALVALQLACFPTMQPWQEDQFKSQLKVWPESQLGIFVDDKLVASAAHLVVEYGDYSNWSDFWQMSDNGYIRNHDPEGDSLYGIEIQVHPDYRGMKLSRRLYDARKTLCRDRNLARMMIGGRIPGYAPRAS